jgi:hypothetical protein
MRLLIEPADGSALTAEGMGGLSRNLASGKLHGAAFLALSGLCDITSPSAPVADVRTELPNRYRGRLMVVYRASTGTL